MRYLLITLLIFSNCKSLSSLRVQDSESIFYESVNKYNEINDCSVRAVADLFDLSYYKALQLTKSWGRESRKGMPLNLLLKGVRKDFRGRIVSLTEVNGVIDAKYLVDNIVEEGFSYLAITKNHAFVIKKLKKDQKYWYLIGNYNDNKKYIIGYIQVKKL